VKGRFTNDLGFAWRSRVAPKEPRSHRRILRSGTRTRKRLFELADRNHEIECAPLNLSIDQYGPTRPLRASRTLCDLRGKK
jgi:hypothetical protein